MSHLGLLLLGLAFSWLWRAQVRLDRAGSWAQRWQWAWIHFLLPPLFLLTTALALAWMGPRGQMAGAGGWFSYGCALLVLAAAAGLALRWIGEYWCSCQRAHRQALAQVNLCGFSAYVLDLEIPFAAQVGVWNSQLVVSRGLLQQLDEEHLRAVLIHEEAHRHYRDTLWMLAVGWLRRLSAWLPNTELLWQELLTLRELRADRWAAQRVDPLVLGEALLQVVSYGRGQQPSNAWVGFALEMDPPPGGRLQERIEALLQPKGPEASGPSPSRESWGWLGLALLPLLAIPFHT
ncbi:M56 family metallopeptidase [Synechococcus sp. R65.1]|uniref:M56 family metallopeptidase n=1 Tax=Synechococcus sp. R65.1 TaxID=2964524 RepID=UPI0039C4AB95